MASDLNSCSFIGRLGRDPETRQLGNGDTVANFSIAVGESWKDKTTGEKVEKVEWVRCVAFRQLGEIVGKYLAKGKQVYVSGKMTTRKWQNKEGVDQYTTEIVVDRMQMLGDAGGRDGGGAGSQRQAPASAPAQRPKDEAYRAAAAGSGFDAMDDDEIPF